MSPVSIRIALDWTPNTIHTGLYVAIAKGYYASRNLAIELLPPDADYTSSPAKRLASGEVDLAVCPSDSCIAYRETGKLDLKAIYAILALDASAIVSTKPEFSKIKNLQNGTYGSYNARYEDYIVKSMVAQDGGKADNMKVENSSGKLSLFEEMRKGNVDATWVFLPWEGVEAERDNIVLNVFKPEDYGVPYGYSPVIALDAKSQTYSNDVLADFVAATREGYAFAQSNAVESAQYLEAHCVPKRSVEFLEQSQKAINGFYGEAGRLGRMEIEKWDTWVGWLRDQGLLEGDVRGKDLFVNI